MQLLHEVYPDGLRDLSRDVLFIREVEVLDKLEVSDINKFLHLYVSETLPKPINGNMVGLCRFHSILAFKIKLVKSPKTAQIFNHLFLRRPTTSFLSSPVSTLTFSTNSLQIGASDAMQMAHYKLTIIIIIIILLLLLLD